MSQKLNLIKDKCQICDVVALYSHFGVKSCDPCKTFFRRNANNFNVHSNGNCEITINTRHICPSCRLNKCLKCGMTTDKFRCSRSIHHKHKEKCLIKLQQNRNETVQFQLINLIEQNQSLLTENESRLLTNLFYCYNECPILLNIDHLTDEDTKIPLNQTIYQSLLDQFLINVYSASARYLSSNDDIRHLSDDDRSLLLYNAADNITCIGGAFLMEHYHLYNLKHYFNLMINKYGLSTMNIHLSARKYIDQNIILVKLAISLFAFSQNNSFYYSNKLTDSIAIVHIQNKYAELTWKYLIYTYGLNQSIQKFLNIILWFSSMNILANHAQSIPIHINDIQSIIEKTEIELILNDVEQIFQT